MIEFDITTLGKTADHFYKIIHKNHDIFCSLEKDSTSCYISFYNLVDSVFYDDIHSIQQVVISEFPFEAFEKTVTEICNIFNFESKVIELEENYYQFEIVFGPSPNMGCVKFCLDTIRYSWELRPPMSKVILQKNLKDFPTSSGLQFIEDYFTFCYNTFDKYSGHGMDLIEDYRSNEISIEELINRVKRYPKGRSTMFLCHHLDMF